MKLESILLPVALGLTALGALYIVKGASVSNFTTTKKEYFNVGRDFDDIEVPLIHKHKNILHKIGWTVPFTHQLPDRFPPAQNMDRVSNDSYSIYDDTPRQDGFAGNTYAFAGSMVPVTPYAAEGESPLPVNTTDPLATAAIGDTDTIPSILVDPHVLEPRVVDLQNQILKMIIANTTSTNVILTNIDTIKQSIATYRHKLKLAYDQVIQRNITPIQLQQFLMQIISDIAAKLELPLTPAFTAMLNSSPFQPVMPL